MKSQLTLSLFETEEGKQSNVFAVPSFVMQWWSSYNVSFEDWIMLSYSKTEVSVVVASTSMT